MEPPRPPPPPIRGPPGHVSPISPENARRAIETVKAALSYVAASVLARRGPAGDTCIDIVLLYHGFALDRIHYDPLANAPSPKGRPVCLHGYPVQGSAEARAQELAKSLPSELWVVEATEYRAPERVWVVPLAWRNYIVAHIRVSDDGSELVPDYGLTEEVRRYIA